MTDIDDLRWADNFPGREPCLGEIFCLTFIRGVDEREALRRMGGLPGSFATRTPSEMEAQKNFDNGYPEVASALPLGDWTVVFEPGGFHGTGLTPVLSRGTEAVSVLRHDYASPGFAYSVDGELVTGFDPTFPAYRTGADPDRLLTRMREVGFAMGEDDDNFDRDTARGLVLVERLTGVLPTLDALTGPLVSAHFEPWFTDKPKQPAGRPGVDGPVDAIAETRRLTGLLGLTGTPGLAEALAAAERGEKVTVSPESPLGRHVRDWLAESRRAGRSLNDHSGQVTEEKRRRAFDHGWLARALGAALQQVR
ncbi:DUF6461 domain-containing protein [Amycolatopsis sp. YIM 10]|uniref:DUF6461 domain-containing protein n=1 Tax=Amycolatopsis sp. YIM 10 TaxID=2653857 RepID=UPI00128FFBB8|nr:DUF6461 domain-containing protein [Amycolatopsis sp. YIM 10]QFU91047.1 hypothetical protein YIM_29405 [Amycolatopsis sp. YIM 10]